MAASKVPAQRKHRGAAACGPNFTIGRTAKPPRPIRFGQREIEPMRTVLKCWLACLSFAWASAAAGAAAEPSGAIAKLVVPQTYWSMALSPDGKQLAAIHYEPQQKASFLTLIDVDAMTERTLVPARRVQRGGWEYMRMATEVNWIGNELLAVDFNDLDCEAVDLRGKTVHDLGERFIRRMKRNGADSDWVLVYRDVEDGDLAEVNVRTGETINYRVSLPGKLVDWAFDDAGVLRAVTTRDTAFWSDRTKISNWYRASETAAWQLLEETPVTEESWRPMYVPGEPDSIVVLSRNERDTRAVFRYDTKTRKHVELMAGHANEDILSVEGLEREILERVSTEGLKPKTFWFDKRWASLQASVDSALPGQVNRLTGNPTGWVLVQTESDVDPGRWFVLDTTTMTMKFIARAKPQIDPKQMRPMETLRYPSFDGLSVPAYLTRPAGTTGAVPLVVLIHGGPHVRDRWQWDEEVQLLAAHGFAVFQPQFRGSTGFGRAFEHAGYGQWGLAMQDDITAGVRHLIEQKIADPQRICIYGGSYGGYAALWGLAKTPSLYQCGISFAGVSDIEEMLNDSSDSNADPVTREIQRVRFGDPKARRQQFADVSPLKHAAKIQAPVFIVHGKQDVRVPASHSRRMIAALEEHGKRVESRFFDDEGHGLGYIKNRHLYYADLLQFLNRHIGPAAARQP